MKTKRIISLLLIFIFMMSMSVVTASAKTSGSNQSTTMYVTTKANWLKSGCESITLTPKPGIDSKGNKFYCPYSVAVYRYGKGTTKYYTLDSAYKGSSLKINLDRNASYKITVSPKPVIRLSVNFVSFQAVLRVILHGMFQKPTKFLR